MGFDLDTLGYFLFMEEEERKARIRSTIQEKEEADEDLFERGNSNDKDGTTGNLGLFRDIKD